MGILRNRKVLAAGALAAMVFAAGASLATDAFDLSPEQPNRLRVEKNDKRIAEVPAEFKFVNDGALTIGISTSGHLPLHDYASDSKTVIGYDVDLAQAIADSLGRDLELVSVAWADWPLGLVSGKFDAVISNVTVTEERKEKFDFSTYRKDELGFYVKADSKIRAIKAPKDIAGLKVITDAGTNQEKILLEWDRQNLAAGLSAAEVQYYDDDAVKDLAVQSGRADVVFSVNATQAYSAAINGKTKLVGTVSGGWPISAEIAVTTRKGSGLAEPLTGVVNDLIASGDYRKILETWKLGPEAIEKAQTNPPGLPRSGS